MKNEKQQQINDSHSKSWVDLKKKKKMGGCDGSCEELPYAKNCLKLFHQDSVGGRLSVFSLYSPLSTPDVFWWRFVATLRLTSVTGQLHTKEISFGVILFF